MQIRLVKIYIFRKNYSFSVFPFLHKYLIPLIKRGKSKKTLNELVRKDITKCGVTDNMALQLSWKVELTKPILHRWIKVSWWWLWWRRKCNFIAHGGKASTTTRERGTTGIIQLYQMYKIYWAWIHPKESTISIPSLHD